MDPTATDKMFCQCSDYVVRPIMTQGPAPGAAFAPCAYKAPATTTMTSSSIQSALFIGDTSSTSGRDPPNAGTSTLSASSSGLPSPLNLAGETVIPLWGACSPGTAGTCIAGSRCVCKDQWYSQCRIPIQGSYTPIGESWLCAQKNVSTSVSWTTDPTVSMSIKSNFSTPSLYSTPPTVTNTNSISLPITNSLSSNQSLSFTQYSPSSVSASESRADSPQSPTTSQGELPAITTNRNRISATLHRSVPYIATATRPLGALTLTPSLHTNVSLPSLTPLPKITSSLPKIIISSPSTTSANVATSGSQSGDANPTNTIPLPPTGTLLRGSSTAAILPSPASILNAAPLVNVLPLSSSYGPTTLTPTSVPTASFQCPLPTIIGPPTDTQNIQPQVARRADGATCNMQPGNTISNLSSTANTPNGQAIAPSYAIDPDTNGTYLQAGTTPEQLAQCTNIAAHQLQACWQILNVTGFITDWTAFNQNACNEESMGFADCFLYLELGGGANCSSFTGRSQCPVPDTRDFVGKHNAAQVYYVAFNIWNIQNWFFTYWVALDGANGLTTDNVGAICRLLNLPLPKPFPLLEVLAVMAFALGLISPSGWGAEIPVLGEKTRNALTAIQVPGEYLLRGVQGSPTLARNLLTTGDLTQTEVQITQIESGIAMIVSQLQLNIQSAIVGVMGNFTLFMDFVSDGFFSTQIEDLNTVQQNITKALQTYVVSQALQDDNVIITRAVDTDVHALATNGTNLAYDIGCTQGYDQWGMCNAWWYDSENNISYGLESWKDSSLNYTKVLEDLFNQGIITPDLLFRGSQVCADASGSNQGNAPGTSLSTSIGVWNAECVSNMKICTWDLGTFSQQHEYTDCPYESDFALESCGDGEDGDQAKVPINYIGPWLTWGEYEGIVCN